MDKKVIKFPQDFKVQSHRVIAGATQWTYPVEGQTIISIVGGGPGLYGDGINNFEMYDFREDDVQPYQTTDDINNHLEQHPI